MRMNPSGVAFLAVSGYALDLRAHGLPVIHPTSDASEASSVYHLSNGRPGQVFE